MPANRRLHARIEDAITLLLVQRIITPAESGRAQDRMTKLQIDQVLKRKGGSNAR